MVRGSGKGGGGRGKGKSTGGRPDGGKSTGGAQEEKLMIDPHKPEMTQLLQLAYRKKQAAKLDSAKKDAAERRKQARQGAPAAESGPREDEETEKLIRSLLEKASGMWKVGTDLKRDMLAYLEASIRVASNKQSEISDIPRFSIPEDATFEDLVRLKEQRLERFNIIKSIDIEGLAVVTPPTNLETFQIIDVTHPSDTDPNKVVSVAQFLFSETNNYFLGGRPTPPDPTAKHGFFVFSNVTLPGYFGTVHHMSCSSRYSMIGSVKVSITCLPDLVKQFLLLTDKNCKHISPYMVELLEVCMFLFGEFDRMQPPVDFLLNNFTYLLIFISAEVLVYMRNWSYLSKAAFAFYLGLLEISLGVVGYEDTFLRGRKQMASAVRKFTKLGCQLELRGEDGFFSLRKLAGGCLQLLKFDEEYIKRLIIRKNRKHSGAMEEIKGLVSVQCEADAKAEAEAEQLSKEELDKEEKEAEKELKHWVRLLLRDKMELIEALYQVNMDQDDNDQGVDEGEPSRSPASVPSSSGQGNELSDVLPPHNTVCSKVPSVPEHADSLLSSPGQGNKLSDVLPPNNTVCSKVPSAPDNTVCSKVPSASEHVDSLPSSPGQGNKLSHGLAHLCIVGGKLPSPPEYVSSGTSTSSECVTASSVVNTLGMSTSSSTGSLGSEKKGLNPKAKEFKLNPNAKSFSTSPSLNSHHQSVSDAPYNYPNNMGFTTGLGLPVGIGSPQQYGGVPVVYNVPLGSSPQSFMYPYGPQFLYNAQAGPSPEGYMHPSAQFLYNAQSGPSPDGYMHPSGQLGPQQMMTGQTGPVYYHAHQNGRRNL